MMQSNFSKSRRGIAGPKSSTRSARPKHSSKGTAVQSKPPAGREILTPRERAVLQQIGRGASSKEAGAALGVSSRTIEFHRSNIRRKLGAKNIVDLLILALDKDAER
jgi:DNA-binding CsgD family transcriptional regulator